MKQISLKWSTFITIVITIFMISIGFGCDTNRSPSTSGTSRESNQGRQQPGTTASPGVNNPSRSSGETS